LDDDKKGNIWTCSESAQGWVFSRYESSWPIKNHCNRNESSIWNEAFGVLKANDGNIWFGSSAGVYRYNGNNIIDFKSKEINRYIADSFGINCADKDWKA
jgi:ligand-binding sensor domain-containing protein